MYEAIVNLDFKTMERLIDKGFNLDAVILKDYGYTALGMLVSKGFRISSKFKFDRSSTLPSHEES